MATIVDRVRAALSKAQISDAEIARRLGVTPQAVSGWWRTGRISKTSLSGVARETGRSLEQLIEPETVGEPRPTGYGPVMRDVPIIGNAIATPDFDGYFDDMSFPVGHGEGYIPWPTRDPNAYALRVKGDSMQPRIRPGELVVVEPNVTPLAGQDVVVRTRDGRKMVKQLLIRRSGELTLGSINQDHRQITLALDQVESVHYIAAIVPRGSGKDGPRDPLEGTW